MHARLIGKRLRNSSLYSKGVRRQCRRNRELDSPRLQRINKQTAIAVTTRSPPSNLCQVNLTGALFAIHKFIYFVCLAMSENFRNKFCSGMILLLPKQLRYKLWQISSGPHLCARSSISERPVVRKK